MSILNERLQVLCISPFTWPDNVRDLQSLIERSHCLSTGSPDSFLAELKDQLRRMEEDETSGYGHPTGLGPSTEDVIENHLLNWKRSEEPLEELLRTSTEESVASVLDRLLNTGWESPEDGKGWGKMLGIPNLENQSRKGFPRNNMCANALLQLSASRALLPETVKRYIEETFRTRGVE